MVPTRKVGVFQNFSGGFSGPDGLAVDEQGGLAGMPELHGKRVAVRSARRAHLSAIVSCRGTMTTNAAYGGPDRRTLFITEFGKWLCADRSSTGCRIGHLI